MEKNLFELSTDGETKNFMHKIKYEKADTSDHFFEAARQSVMLENAKADVLACMKAGKKGHHVGYTGTVFDKHKYVELPRCKTLKAAYDAALAELTNPNSEANNVKGRAMMVRYGSRAALYFGTTYEPNDFRIDVDLKTGKVTEYHTDGTVVIK